MEKVLLRSVTLDLPIYSARSRSLKNALLSAGTGGRISVGSGSQTAVIRALSDINLQLSSGDRLGLIGTNGAGKSTLMRVITGIYKPTAGTIHVQGKIGSLFDLGLGMDQEATGFENIRIRGLMLGMKLSEIEALVPDVESFTELGSYLDLPIRTYSAGMQARLAFAISTSIRPDVLVIDEGIGAGDANFMHKATKRLEAFMEQVGILVLASHSKGVLNDFCNKGVVMHRGRMSKVMPIADANQMYSELINERDAGREPAEEFFE